jgi:hypothetical protein
MMNKNKSELEKVDTLYAEISDVLEKARASAYRAADHVPLVRIGHCVLAVEYVVHTQMDRKGLEPAAHSHIHDIPRR